MEIRKIGEGKMNDALQLIWDVFLKYEAPDYTDEGIKEFKKSIDDINWIKQREFFGAYIDDLLVGVIATKDKHHIALFFVDGEHQGKGIGSALYKYVKDLNEDGYFTVNSSPYAKEIYEHLGFVCEVGEQEVNGLKFYPMRNDYLR